MYFNNKYAKANSFKQLFENFKQFNLTVFYILMLIKSNASVSVQ